MIYVLDTDHISLLAYKDSLLPARIRRRMVELPEDVSLVATVISFEEQMRGWMAALKKRRSFEDEVPIYGRLLACLEFFKGLTVLPFDETAAHHANSLTALRLRVGSMDLRIAAIALAADATVITRNEADFSKFPGLRFDDWSREN